MNLKLAKAALEEAKKNYHGNTEAAITNLQTLVDLFAEADEVTLETLDRDWSGAFAYLCVQKAGYGLPMMYPDPRVGCSFASVAAWERYARLPKIHLWHLPAEPIEIGDLVILETPQEKPPQMGIVLQIDGDRMEIAVGNYHNHSSIIEHAKEDSVRGFIRLENL